MSFTELFQLRFDRDEIEDAELGLELVLRIWRKTVFLLLFLVPPPGGHSVRIPNDVPVREVLVAVQVGSVKEREVDALYVGEKHPVDRLPADDENVAGV